MKHIIIKFLNLSVILVTLLTGCKKDFLNIKPSTEIVQPNSLEDFQNLLDNTNLINNTTALGVLASDEYTYPSFAIWQSARTATERNSYIWATDLFEGEFAAGDWSRPYTAIFYANNVLDGLNKIEITSLNKIMWNNIKGWALFVRANAYYDLVKNFSPVYDASTASTDPGVPLRLSPSIDEILQRSSVQQTFDQILLDLGQATSLLDVNLPIAHRNRPSKIAAHALSARIFLNMRDYVKAELHADTCLQLYNKLIDYNTLDLTSKAPFVSTNDELIYNINGHNSYVTYATGNNKYIAVSPEIIDLYQPNDLRLDVYFLKQTDGTYDFKRGLSATTLYPFVGLATDEIYLIKAECAARRNDVPTAMVYLNRLLIKRYTSNKFTAVTADTKTEALNIVLLERRKELVWRALRWDDLKRLNKEGTNITLTRVLNGITYTLEPNSSKYIFPIPDDEILLSGIQQNIR